MAWVKKNLFILIAGVVSLGILGYAIVFVNGKMEADAAVAATLDDSAGKFRNLVQRPVHPGNEKIDNIKTAKEELVTMRSFMGEMQEFLKGPEIGTNMGNKEFRALLDTSLTQLRRQAEEAGITMPSTNYWFTFASYKTTVDFKGDMAGLAAQLEDIKSIMAVLSDARVHSLVALRRAPVSDSDYFGTSDYLAGRQPRTNDWAITTGYEVTFQGFSSELARVMEGLANAKQCFVVKSLGVAKAPEERKPGAAPMMPIQQFIPQPMMRPGMDPRYMQDPRYMMRPQMPMPVAPAPAARPAPGTGHKTVLDEAKLRFTVTVDSVRLKPKQR